MALLSEMGRSDAVPHMARLAANGSAESRWQALRHCLSLDTAAGFGLLDTVARNPDDTLSKSASALRCRLIRDYPVLAELASEPCPA